MKKFAMISGQDIVETAAPIFHEGLTLGMLLSQFQTALGSNSFSDKSVIKFVDEEGLPSELHTAFINTENEVIMKRNYGPDVQDLTLSMLRHKMAGYEAMLPVYVYTANRKFPVIIIRHTSNYQCVLELDW